MIWRNSSRIFVGVAMVTLSWTAAANFTAKQADVLKDYVKIQETLAADSTAGVKDLATGIATKSDVPAVKKAAQDLAKSTSIEDARKSFKSLSAPIVEMVKKEKQAEYEVLSCSMAKGSWVQKKGEIRNPYYGKQMLTCGERG